MSRTGWSNVDAGFHGAATGTNFVDTNPNGTTTTRIRVTRVTGPPFVTDGTWNTRRFIFNNATPLTIRRVESANTLVLNAAFGSPGTFGFTYSVGNYPRYCDGQCFYDMTVAVDPTDPDGNRVYVGGNPRAFAPNFAPNLNELLPPVTAHSHWRTDDGGLKWSSISQGDGTGASLHTDDHAWGFGANGSIYNGNDGGIWRSDDRGASWTSMNTDIVITQFQGLSLHPTNPNVVLGGTQDNGTNLRNPKVLAPPKWFHSDFGDGGVSVIDQSTPATMFHTYFNQSNNFMGPARTDNGGVDGPGSWPFVGAYAGYGGRYYNGMNPKDPVSFYAPMAQHPAFTPNVIYFGSNRVYRSANPQPFIFTDPPPATQPQSWTAVSPALTKNPAGTAYLSWIGVLPNLINGKEVLYTGASDGRLEATAAVDGSGIAAWTVLDKAPLPNRAVTQVLPVGGDPTGNTAYATFSGFDNATPATPGHVFKTTNGLGAATWTNITGDLPNIPVNQIVADPDDPATLYVGTDIGVFRTRDGGGHWVHLSNGLPNVTIFALQMDPQRNRVVASTHGRGMFELLSSGGPKAP